MGKWSRSGDNKRLGDRNRLRNRLSRKRKRSRNRSRKDKGLVSQSYWSLSQERLWVMDNRRDSCRNEDWSGWDSISGIDRLSISSFPIRTDGNFSLGFFVSSKMLGTSGGNFRSLLHRYGGDKRGRDRNFWSNGKSNCSSSGSYWDIGGGNSESVDIISSVVNCLDHIVGINILVTSSGHSKSVLGLSSGRVDVLVTEAELTQLILSVELT